LLIGFIVKVEVVTYLTQTYGPELIPVCMQSVNRWLSHKCVSRLLLLLGLQLPSWPQSFATFCPVPNCTTLWQKHKLFNSSRV